ncbi:MAG: glycosyltransferase family 2 protein [Erythrobacter sp.]
MNTPNTPSGPAAPPPAPSARVRLSERVDHDISVVIVSYNTRDMTLECVASVLDDAGELAVEIIVVDNQSNDGSSAALRERFPGISVIDSPANGGFAYGNAIGFEQSHGRFVLLLNPDTRLHKGALQASIEHMAANPKTGIMGARVWLDDGSQQSSAMRFLTLKQFAINLFVSNQVQRRHAILGDTRYASLSFDETHRVDSVSGCYMFVRREVIGDIGALDTRFFMYGEETEWCHRARRAGWDVVYNPKVEILHHGAASTAHLSEWKAIEMTRGQLLFLRFTRGSLVAWLAALLMTLRDLLRAPLYAMKALLGRPDGASAWRARLGFLLGALVRLPKGQSVTLPSPDAVNR